VIFHDGFHGNRFVLEPESKELGEKGLQGRLCFDVLELMDRGVEDPDRGGAERDESFGDVVRAILPYMVCLGFCTTWR
jgi:hypothetical protein